jgi:hypothetical protein
MSCYTCGYRPASCDASATLQPAANFDQTFAACGGVVFQW